MHSRLRVKALSLWSAPAERSGDGAFPEYNRNQLTIAQKP
jgi:hypothetical protein